MSRILFVDQSRVLGGAELSLIDIARNISDSEVAVFQEGPFSDRLRDLGIRTHILAESDGIIGVSRGGGVVAGLLAVPALLKTAMKLAAIAASFDLIYANTQKAMLVAALAGLKTGTPVVWHLRDLMDSEHFSTSHIRTAILTANILADNVIANSNATAAAFVKAGGNASKVVTIHNGIDKAPYTGIDKGLCKRIRTELGLEEKNVAGMFSRIADWKGQHVLIEAVAGLPDWHALIVGDALFQDDEKYKANLKDLVRARGLENRIHFLGFRDDIPVLMATSDVVVHASTLPEPFGRVIVESMLARTPVVASNGGGAAEIVRHGKNGFLFDANNPAELGKLLESIKDRVDATDMVATAFEEAVDYYSVDRLVSEVRSVIEQHVVQ